MKPTAILKSRELELTFFQIVFRCAKTANMDAAISDPA